MTTNDDNNRRRRYEKPTVRVFELQHRTMLLCGSPTGTNGNPTYNPFNDEEEW